MNKLLSLIRNVNINKFIVAIANAADKHVLCAVKEAIEKNIVLSSYLMITKILPPLLKKSGSI